MASSVSLIVKYLDNSKKEELAQTVTKNLGNRENLEVFSQIIDDIDVSKVYPDVLKYAVSIVNDIDKDFNDLILLVSYLPQLYKDVVDTVLVILRQYLKNPGIGLIYEFQKFINFDVVGNDYITEEFVIRILDFLQELFKKIENPYNHDSIISTLLVYYGINDDRVLASVSQIFRWKIDDISNHELIWNTIFVLQNSTKSHKSFAFILWLRYLSSSPNLEVFENVIVGNEYWSCIQLGLLSDSHEHRKYCLSILQLSVKMINIDIDNDFINWNNAKFEEQLTVWSRYVTLFEILGIDTSLHQAEAGMNDIINLISPNSLIKSSWGFCLLSTGFKATMESVRKFSLKLLMSIPPLYLYQIKDCPNFLEEIYLPNIMLAGNFGVQVIDGKNTCLFGDCLVEFIANLISNLSDDDAQAIVLSILKVLALQKDCFDPIRIYMGIGVIQGLGDKQVLQFGVHDQYLIKLFESNSEGDMFEKICQTINLKLLLNFNFDQRMFFATLDNFSKVNGYKYILENAERIKHYLDEQEIDVNNDEILLCGLTGKTSFSGSLNAIKLLETGLLRNLDTESTSYYQSLLDQVISGDEDNLEIIKSFSMVDFSKYPNIILNDLSKLWESICHDMESKDTHQLTVMINKYRLFNNLYQNSDFKFKDGSCVLGQRVLPYSRELSKTVSHFYKLHDEVYGEYYTALEITNSKMDLNFDELMDVVNSSTGHLRSNIAMVNLLNDISHKVSNVEPIVTFICDLWKNLVADRLQLNQKELQIRIIETMLDPVILVASEDNDSIINSLREFCISVLENSEGRRSLLPSLTSKLSEFQVKAQKNFESLKWVPEVLVRAFTVHQLRNSTFKLETIIGELFNKTLSATKSDIYKETYGPEEISARVNLMAILNSIKSKQFAKLILNFIFENQEEFHFFKIVKSSDGLEEWTRLQLLCVIVSIMDKTEVPVNVFLKLLDTDPSPLVRVYMEWVIAYSLLKDVKMAEEVLEEFIKTSSTLRMPTLLAYQRLLFIMTQTADPATEVHLLSKLLTVVIPNSTANKAVTRHFSVSLIVAAFNEIKRKSLKIDEKLFKVVTSINESAVSSETFGNFRSGDALLWNVEEVSMINISGGLLLRLTDRTDFDFINKETYLKHLTTDQLSLLNHGVGEDCQDLWALTQKTMSRKQSSKGTEKSPLQTKSGAWSSIMDVDESTRGSEVVRSDLIVVSSLVDKAPNLGGICRLCDVLGAGLLTLNDISVKNNGEFKNVAVTADRWMPMIEVKMEDIKQFLKDKKKEGYTLIGLEQTDKSVQLNHELKFPKKSLILLGKEKEGVPGDLLAELDFCVEIKQVGVIRSMNIQTATAVIVHAYSVQHC
jgi:tRNA guanosine-2'-O-methyltransferase